jgi:acetoin utilization protein AcuC
VLDGVGSSRKRLAVEVDDDAKWAVRGLRADSRRGFVSVVRGCASRLVFDDGVLGYDFGPQHPLTPRRLRTGLHLIRSLGVLDDGDMLEPREATDDELQLVHSPDYIEVVKLLSEPGQQWDPAGHSHGFGPGDNPAFAGMHNASALIAGGSLQAARGVMAGDFLHAFNPGGGLHHAMRSRASGFCVYNDLAVAIAALLREHDARVLYLDFDVHHGDGVQWLFYDEPRVMTVSFHESGRYLFPGTGDITELGEGAAKGTSVNVPMAPYTQNASWLEAVHTLVPALAERHRPDFIVSQHGCDTHTWDPLAHLALTTEAYREQADFVHQLAHAHCQGRWIVGGGGGYDFYRVVPRSWALIWLAMTGRPAPEYVPEAYRYEWQGEAPMPLPELLVDGDAEFPLLARHDTIADENRATLDAVRRLVLG